MIKDILPTEDRISVGLNIQDKSYKEKFQIASKLHTRVGRPSQDKLHKLLKQAGVNDDQFLSILESIRFDCEICAKYKRSNPRPVAGFSLAKEFNETVAWDLKPYRGVHFLHLIDLATRYSNAVVIHSKGKQVTVKNIMLHWIVYGYSPNQIVFGCNPNLPSCLNDKPHALEGTTSSEVAVKTLNALHAACKAFIENEASEKLRRVLSHKIRPITTTIYSQRFIKFSKNM